MNEWTTEKEERPRKPKIQIQEKVLVKDLEE